MTLWQIDVGYACAGVITGEGEKVERTAPIFAWMKGKSISEIERWVRSKKGILRKVR